MFRYACIFYSFALVLFLNVLACAQTGGIDPRNASISGRVTISGKPAANKKVNLVGGKQEGNSSGLVDGRPDQQETFSALTDGDGRYRITGLPAGTFTVEAQMAAYVDEKKSDSRVRSITLDRSEQVENIDISLVRGGVITGRITDSTGHPLIAKKVRLQRAQDNTARDQNASMNGFGLFPELVETDDRGIYRAYGLPAGKYIISAGSEISGDEKYPLTYHPDAVDDNQATRIEVKEGTEVTGIDIRFGSETGTYEALGRVIDAETGEPVPRASLMCFRIQEPGENSVHSGANATSDAQGNFRFSGLPAGNYSVLFSPEFLSSKPGEFYTEESTFRIVDTNLTGVEVRARRGGSISGVVVLENNRDPALRDRLTQMILTALVSKKGDTQPSFGVSGQSMTRINNDGSFRVVGLAPGEVQFGVFSLTGRTPELVRVERDGSQIVGNLEIKRGEVITGVRIILAIGTGVIRGQVEIAGGTLPEGTTMHVIAQRVGAVESDDNVRHTAVDKKGRFVFEGLVDGEYEVLFQLPGDNPSPPATQRVRVISGAEVQVTLRLDPKKDQGREQ